MSGLPGRAGVDPAAELRAALTSAPIAVVATDRVGVCTAAEGMLLDALGLGPSALGRSLADVLLPGTGVGLHLDRAMGGHAVSTTVESGGRSFDVFFRPLTDGGVSGVVVDATGRVRAEQRLAHQTSFDGLTGLPNRQLLVDRLKMTQARASRGGYRSALMFVGMDKLARVNESLGQAAGDGLLVAMGRALRASVRPADTVSRLSGDTFVVLCDSVADESQARSIAARLHDVVADPLPLAGRHLMMTASIGVTMVEPGRDADAILGDAEAALFRAKGQGGARTVVFDPSMRALALARLDTEQALHWALQNNELRVHYQPIVDLGTGAIRGLEALVRWDHPERGRLGPAQFIPLAEETGLIVPIGRWVLVEVARQMRQWADEGVVDDAVTMSVNLSAAQLAQPDLPALTGELLREHALDPSRLCFELTESWLMEDADAALSVLAAVKDLGVAVAIDDFGIGYSSLGYLHRLPIDALKVDRSFVLGLDAEPPDDAIAHAVIDLAHTFGLQAIGEGVETAGHLAALRRLGCDQAQGFHFAKPLPPADVVALLQQRLHW